MKTMNGIVQIVEKEISIRWQWWEEFVDTSDLTTSTKGKLMKLKTEFSIFNLKNKEKEEII